MKPVGEQVTIDQEGEEKKAIPITLYKPPGIPACRQALAAEEDKRLLAAVFTAATIRHGGIRQPLREGLCHSCLWEGMVAALVGTCPYPSGDCTAQEGGNHHRQGTHQDMALC